MYSEHARKDLPNHAESAEDTHSTQANKEACVPHISISRTSHATRTNNRITRVAALFDPNGHGEVFFLDSHTIPTT